MLLTRDTERRPHIARQRQVPIAGFQAKGIKEMLIAARLIDDHPAIKIPSEVVDLGIICVLAGCAAHEGAGGAAIQQVHWLTDIWHLFEGLLAGGFANIAPRG